MFKIAGVIQIQRSEEINERPQGKNRTKFFNVVKCNGIA